MAISMDQIILDAQRMANRLKDREALSNALLVETEGINRQLQTMKQFQDDVDSLNQLSRDKSNADMVNRINQQNTSISEIRQENRELKASLEDHQRALEIIMQKYREHVYHKVLNSRINFKELYNAQQEPSDMILKQAEKINEMAAVMQRAASVDDDSQYVKQIEYINRLKVENQGLREVLEISKQFGSLPTEQKPNIENKGIQTDLDDNEFLKNGETDTDTIIENFDKTSIPDKEGNHEILINGHDNNNHKESDS